MCGVIGYAPVPGVTSNLARGRFAALLDQSRVRGTHAYGLANYQEWQGSESFGMQRSHSRAEVWSAFDPSLVTVAHSRFSTSGDHHVMANNQPLLVTDERGTMALAFNGVIHQGTREEFESHFGVHCDADNDGEVFARRVLAGQDPVDFLRENPCSFAGVWLRDGVLHALRNEERPLWIKRTGEGEVWVASTRDIFQRAGLGEPEPVQPYEIRRFQP